MNDDHSRLVKQASIVRRRASDPRPLASSTILPASTTPTTSPPPPPPPLNWTTPPTTPQQLSLDLEVSPAAATSRRLPETTWTDEHDQDKQTDSYRCISLVHPTTPIPPTPRGTPSFLKHLSWKHYQHKKHNYLARHLASRLSSTRRRLSLFTWQQQPKQPATTSMTTSVLTMTDLPTECLVVRCQSHDDHDDDVSLLGMDHPLDVTTNTTVTAVCVVTATPVSSNNDSPCSENMPECAGLPPVNVQQHLDAYSHKLRPALAHVHYTNVVGTDYEPQELGKDASFWEM